MNAKEAMDKWLKEGKELTIEEIKEMGKEEFIDLFLMTFKIWSDEERDRYLRKLAAMYWCMYTGEEYLSEPERK